MLRPRGLIVQAAKSEIFEAEYAKSQIDSIRFAVDKLSSELRAEASLLLALQNPYLSDSDMETLLADDSAQIEDRVYRHVYQRYFNTDDKPDGFDKSLFKFIIKRLGQRKDSFAVDHSLTLLNNHPEVTEPILGYVKACDAQYTSCERVLEYVHSSVAVYPYQKYQILKWLGSTASPSRDSMQLAREIAFDYNQPFYLRSVAQQMLGEYGSYADLERLERAYHNTTDTRERSELVLGLKRMEKIRRNAFLARIEHDSVGVERATKLVRSLVPR